MRHTTVTRVLGCLVAVLALAGCEWAQIGFGPDGAVYNAVEPAITPDTVAELSVGWSQPCSCESRPLVVGGRVFVTDTGGMVRTFAAGTGAPGWSRAFPAPQLSAVANGLVYLIVGRDVVALDAGTGETRWTIAPPAPGSGELRLEHLVVDGAIAFVDVTSTLGGAAGVSEISALDVNGTVLWSTTPGGDVGGFAGVPVTGEPDRNTRMLVVVSELVAAGPSPVQFLISQLDEDGGRTLHQAFVAPSHPWTSTFGIVQVSAAPDRVFFDLGGNRGDGGLLAVDPDSGAVDWSLAGANQAFARTHDVLVVTALDRAPVGPFAVDPATGVSRWDALGAAASNPSIAGDVVLSATGGGVEARALADGRLLGSFAGTNEAFGPAVTPANGRIFAGSTAHLYALDPTG